MEKNEKEILTLIRYLPPVIVIVFSMAVTYYLYTQKSIDFDNETKKLEQNYIELNKKNVMYQVKRVKERILYEKSIQTEKLKKRLKNNVDNAYEIINNIYLNNKDKSKDEILSMSKDALKHIKFNNGRSYIFIFSLDGTNILHPEKKYLENKNLWNAQDVKGTYYIQEMNKILQNKDSTYYSWYWKKNNKDKEYYEKLGYFKLFKPYNIFIGTGEYIADFEKELKDSILNDISNFFYGEDGYTFILDYKGTYLAYYNSSLIGKNIYSENSSDDIDSIFNKMLKAVEKGGDFISYYHNNPATLKKSFKYTYIDSIEYWNWIIGTGFYMNNFFNDIDIKKKVLLEENKRQIKNLLIFSLIFTIFLLLIFKNISTYLEEKFKRYRIDLLNEIKNNIKKDNILAHQSKMAAMGEMIGNIAHQWRQPLSTISTIVTGLKIQKEVGIVDKKLEEESLELINKHVQYLSQTIDDFRSFFKTEKEPKEFYIESVFDKALSLVNAQFNSKNIIIIKNIEHCKLNNLENELIQVLINILNNARDELLKRDDERYIFIDTKIKGENIFIFIKDNGGGIQNNILPKVFDAYFTTKKDSDGTGIGLFMTEEMVLKHLKGNIIVSNDEYEYKSKKYIGAIFTIILPIIKN